MTTEAMQLLTVLPCFKYIPGTFDLARQTLGRTRMPPGRDIDMNMSVLTNQVQGLDGVSRFGGDV